MGEGGDKVRWEGSWETNPKINKRLPPCIKHPRVGLGLGFALAN